MGLGSLLGKAALGGGKQALKGLGFTSTHGTTLGTLTGSAIGAGIGGIQGAIGSEYENINLRAQDIFTGALKGGLIGAGIGFGASKIGTVGKAAIQSGKGYFGQLKPVFNKSAKGQRWETFKPIGERMAQQAAKAITSNMPSSNIFSPVKSALGLSYMMGKEGLQAGAWAAKKGFFATAEHPFLVGGAAATAGGLGYALLSPTEYSPRENMNINYDHQAVARENLGGELSPMRLSGTSSEILGKQNSSPETNLMNSAIDYKLNRLNMSTMGLVQGLHQSRHSNG